MRRSIMEGSLHFFSSQFNFCKCFFKQAYKKSVRWLVFLYLTYFFFYVEGIARQLWHHVADLLMLIKWTLSGGKLLQCTSPSAGTELPTVLCSLFT